MYQNVAYDRPGVQHLSKFMRPHMLEQISYPDFSALLKSLFLKRQVLPGGS